MPAADCETTSTEALDNYLTTLYSQLRSRNIVGSRVDVVAHSMGGLVTRNYASGASTALSYRNGFNRFQGTFRTIVTLDTPELGSPISWFLDNLFANKVEDPSQYPIPGSFLTFTTYPTYSGLLWAKACGSNKQITFRQCLKDQHTTAKHRPAFALWALTVSVLLDVIAIPILGPINKENRYRSVDLPVYQAVWAAFLLLSYSLQVLAAAMVHRDRTPARRILRIGTSVVVLGNSLCLILYYLAQPGKPLS